MAYADKTVDVPIQVQRPVTAPGVATTQVLAIGSGGTLGFDSGATLDESGLPAMSVLESSADNLTAGTTHSQAGGLAITANMNRFTTVANSHDAATLPASVAGTSITVINATATNAMYVYPNAGGTTTETINALSANAPYSLAAAGVVTFVCVTAGQWHTILSAG